MSNGSGTGKNLITIGTPFTLNIKASNLTGGHSYAFLQQNNGSLQNTSNVKPNQATPLDKSFQFTFTRTGCCNYKQPGETGCEYGTVLKIGDYVQIMNSGSSQAVRCAAGSCSMVDGKEASSDACGKDGWTTFQIIPWDKGKTPYGNDVKIGDSIILEQPGGGQRISPSNDWHVWSQTSQTDNQELLICPIDGYLQGVTDSYGLVADCPGTDTKYLRNPTGKYGELVEEARRPLCVGDNFIIQYLNWISKAEDKCDTGLRVCAQMGKGGDSGNIYTNNTIFPTASPLSDDLYFTFTKKNCIKGNTSIQYGDQVQIYNPRYGRYVKCGGTVPANLILPFLAGSLVAGVGGPVGAALAASTFNTAGTCEGNIDSEDCQVDQWTTFEIVARDEKATSGYIYLGDEIYLKNIASGFYLTAAGGGQTWITEPGNANSVISLVSTNGSIYKEPAEETKAYIAEQCSLLCQNDWWGTHGGSCLWMNISNWAKEFWWLILIIIIVLIIILRIL